MKKNYLSRQSFKSGILVIALSVGILNAEIITQTFLFTGVAQAFTVSPCVGSISIGSKGAASINSTLTSSLGEFGGGLTNGTDTYFSRDQTCFFCVTQLLINSITIKPYDLSTLI